MRKQSELEASRNEALNNVLRSALRFFGIIGAVFCLYVVLSGVFWVEEGTVAVHTRWGRILGHGAEAVYPPGGPYWAFPDPIDGRIVVTTSFQMLPIEDQFWCGQIGEEGLNPGEDGFLVTGDHNIVHGRWQLTFRVSSEGDDPVRFILAIGDMDRARRLLSRLTEQALVSAVGRMPVDAFTRGDIDEKSIMTAVKSRLDDIGCGLQVVDLSRSAPPQVPFQVVDDFSAVNEAESAKLKAIENARRDREERLQATAGTAYAELNKAIDRYEDGLSTGLSEDEVSLLEGTIYDILDGESLGGDAAVMIQEARLYGTEIVESFRSRSERFEKLLPAWLKNGEVVEGRLLWETWQRILTGTVNSYYLPSSGGKRIYIHLEDSLNGL